MRCIEGTSPDGRNTGWEKHNQYRRMAEEKSLMNAIRGRSRRERATYLSSPFENRQINWLMEQLRERKLAAAILQPAPPSRSAAGVVFPICGLKSQAGWRSRRYTICETTVITNALIETV